MCAKTSSRMPAVSPRPSRLQHTVPAHLPMRLDARAPHDAGETKTAGVNFVSTHRPRYFSGTRAFLPVVPKKLSPTLNHALRVA